MKNKLMEMSMAVFPKREIRTHFLCVIASLFFLTGCEIKQPMIEDMVAAHQVVSEKNQQERETAVSLAVQKYFVIGMKKEEAFLLLRQLRSQEFNVTEYRYEGRRIWPEGELQPYREDMRLNMQAQYRKNASEFVVVKKHRRSMFSFLRHVSITFIVIDGSDVITEVRGSIALDGL